MKEEEKNIEEFIELLIDELNQMQDYILCPMDIVDSVCSFIDIYIDQEVIRKLNELDEDIKKINL